MGDQIVLQRPHQCLANAPPVHSGLYRHQINLRRHREMTSRQQHPDRLLFHLTWLTIPDFRLAHRCDLRVPGFW
jgi:hypothetical protein